MFNLLIALLIALAPISQDAPPDDPPYEEDIIPEIEPVITHCERYPDDPLCHLDDPLPVEAPPIEEVQDPGERPYKKTVEVEPEDPPIEEEIEEIPIELLTINNLYGPIGIKWITIKRGSYRGSADRRGDYI